MEIPFIKIDNAGNDYIYVRRGSISRSKLSPGALARLISDRNRGVGSDGLIEVDIIDSGSAEIRIFNSDGSEAELCGNGLRGAVLYLRRITGSKRRHFAISTKWKEYELDLIKSNLSAAVVGAKMGNPSFDHRDIGCTGESANCMGISLLAGEKERILYCLAMPNPFAIIFVDNFDFDWQKEGMEIENNSIFKNRINVMFTRVDSKNRVSVMPWERGSGATRACGSGAAAVTVISRMLGYTNSNIVVNMPGGHLRTRWDIGQNEIYQSGPSRIAFTGLFQI